MAGSLSAPDGLFSEAEAAAVEAYVARVVAAAPPPTPELIAKLRRILAVEIDPAKPGRRESAA
jgi:hypothetical protein